MRTAACYRTPVTCTVGLLLVFVASCSSEPGPRSGERRRHEPPPIPMVGQSTFFNGQIVAELKVGGEGIPHPAPGKEGGESGGHGRHGGGGMGMGGGGRGRHGGGQVSESNAEGDSESPRPGMGGGMGPTVMIHLRLTNQSAAPVELGIEDFASVFGNFAVQPEKLSLDPGQSLETEPMSSRLGGSLAETEATLVLRLANKAEKQVIVLRAVTGPTDATGQEPSPGDPPPSSPPSTEAGK